MIDRDVLAASYPRAKLTKPGDVLVTVTPEFGVMIDEHGFSVAEFPVRVLRITEDGRGVLTPRVLAAMLKSQKGTAVRPGQSGKPAMEDHQVMMLAPETVGRLDALLAGWRPGVATPRPKSTCSTSWQDRHRRAQRWHTSAGR